MTANEFTWEQRGWIDHSIGVTFANSPAPDLFEREAWEKGWLEAADEAHKREVRIASRAAQVVLARLQKRQ